MTAYRVAMPADFPAVQAHVRAVLGLELERPDAFGFIAEHEGKLEGYVGVNYYEFTPALDHMAVLPTARQYRQTWELCRGVDFWLWTTGMQGMRYVFAVFPNAEERWRKIVGRMGTEYATDNEGFSWYWREVPDFQEAGYHVQ